MKRPLITALAALATWAAAPVAADTYPSKPVTLLVGYAAGGTADVVARLLAKEMGESMGQSVVVENKAGANALIATNELLRAKPDGYTLLMASLSHVVNPILVPDQAKYDPVTGVTPISRVSTLPLVLATGYNGPYGAVKDLVEGARKDPGSITYGSAGVGGSGHLAGAMLAQHAGVEMTHVPFKGNAPALTEVIADRVSFMFYPTIGIDGQVKEKRVRVLAVGTKDRMDKFPGVPTLGEAGFPGFEETAIWLGVLAPAGTPEPVANRLHQEIMKALTKPEVKEKLASMGTITVGSTPAEFGQFLQADHDRWSKVIKAAGITAAK